MRRHAITTGGLLAIVFIVAVFYQCWKVVERVRNAATEQNLASRLKSEPSRRHDVYPQPDENGDVDFSHIEVDVSSPPEPSWLARLTREPYLNSPIVHLTISRELSADERKSDLAIAKLIPNLTSLTVIGDIDEDQLRAISEIPQLRRLELADQFPEDQLSLLANCKFLEALHVRLSEFKGHSLKSSDLSGLKYLELGGTSIDDRAMIEISQLKLLKKLDLWRTKVTDKGVALLKDNSTIELLELSWTEATERSIPIMGTLRSLKYLSLGRGDNLDDKLKRALPGVTILGS